MKQKERVYHILNGDALKKQFPKTLKGEVVVARECLVDGDVGGNNLDDFFQRRAHFIAKSYGNYSVRQYEQDTVSEFDKIRNIPSGTEVNLWFEDDLFCQVNFWFVTHLLFSYAGNCRVFLVRPKVRTSYGFGGFDEKGLLQLFDERMAIPEISAIASLWEAYQQGELEALNRRATALEKPFPFILQAVKAHAARIPSKGNAGRPAQALSEIIEELGTDEFAPVFREFSKRESIYGFGDLQVKRIWEEVRKRR